MKFLLSVVLIIFCHTFYAQVFTGNGGKISDFNGQYHIDSFPITVNGLPEKINSIFGLSKVCIVVSHPRVSDLKIELLGPDNQKIWLTNRNGNVEGADYGNTCFTPDGFSGYIHEAKAPFRGEYVPDGKFSFINNGQNPNGTWYLLVQDLREGQSGNVDMVNLFFDKNPDPNGINGICANEDPKNCKCTYNKKSGKCELLPDLVLLKKFTTDQIKYYGPNDKYYPNQIRFAATIANIGDGPMEIYGTHQWICNNSPADSAKLCPDGNQPRQKINQRVYFIEEGQMKYYDRKANTNYLDTKPGHNHYHIDNWVGYSLLKVKFSGSKIVSEKVIATGNKISYCLFDNGNCKTTDSLCMVGNVNYNKNNLPNYGLGNYPNCNADFQGISVGGYDMYGMLYEGQYLNVPKNLKGTYYLKIVVDPLHFYREKNTANNSIYIKINI